MVLPKKDMLGRREAGRDLGETKGSKGIGKEKWHVRREEEEEEDVGGERSDVDDTRKDRKVSGFSLVHLN